MPPDFHPCAIHCAPWTIEIACIDRPGEENRSPSKTLCALLSSRTCPWGKRDCLKDRKNAITKTLAPSFPFTTPRPFPLPPPPPSRIQSVGKSLTWSDAVSSDSIKENKECMILFLPPSGRGGQRPFTGRIHNQHILETFVAHFWFSARAWNPG